MNQLVHTKLRKPRNRNPKRTLIGVCWRFPSRIVTLPPFTSSTTNPDAVVYSRGSSFSMTNFRMLFVLVFARMVLTALQVVLSFHGLRNQTEAANLYAAIFVLSIGKIVGSHKVTAAKRVSGTPR